MCHPVETPPTPYTTGQTALSVVVPEAEAVVAPWFGEHVESARYGVRPHVTVLFPFLPVAEVDAGVLAALAAIAAAEPAFDLSFETFGRFPGVLYLEPSPDAPLRRLTRAVADRWPQVPPYGGEYGDDPTPHLTLAQTGDHDAIEADVRTRLPLRVRASELRLLLFDGESWTRYQDFQLGATRSSESPSPLDVVT